MLPPRELSRQLRLDVTPELTRRRWIVGLSLVGTAMAQIVSAYQTGIIRHLPDPPIALFDSDRVDASDYAYKRMQTPDGLLMIITYGVTAALAGAGGRDRSRTLPALSILTATKVLYDSYLAVKLGGEEWADNEALCTYCQIATVCSLVSLGLALPEAYAAVRHVLNGEAKLIPTGEMH